MEAWKETFGMAQVFVRRLQDEEGFSAGFDACKAELVRHGTVAAERIGRLAVLVGYRRVTQQGLGHGVCGEAQSHRAIEHRMA